MEVNSKLKIFSGNCDFVIGAMSLDDIPPTSLPEVAFIGRSNVGKSSLINALTNRNKLARVSQTPGCTRQINFFNLGENIYLVDMPGYGYAKRNKAEKNKWKDLIYYYLTGRQQLKKAFLLLDSRHPLKPEDEKTMSYLDESAVPYQIVLTKIDKVKRSEMPKQIDYFQQKSKIHPACHPQILCTSSVNKDGLEQLQTEITSFL